MDRIYKHLVQSDGSYLVQEVRSDGLARIVAKDHPTYLAWLAAGGVPEVVEYVTPQPPSLEEVKAAKTAEITAIRDAKIAAGVTVTFPAGPAVVQTRNEADLRNINGVAAQGLAALVAGSDETLPFRDAADAIHIMTPIQAVDFGRQVAVAIQAIYSASWAHKDAINKPELTDLATLQTYDVTTGWPEA